MVASQNARLRSAANAEAEAELQQYIRQCCTDNRTLRRASAVTQNQARNERTEPYGTIEQLARRGTGANAATLRLERTLRPATVDPERPEWCASTRYLPKEDPLRTLLRNALVRRAQREAQQ